MIAPVALWRARDRIRLIDPLHVSFFVGSRQRGNYVLVEKVFKGASVRHRLTEGDPFVTMGRFTKSAIRVPIV